MKKKIIIISCILVIVLVVSVLCFLLSFRKEEKIEMKIIKVQSISSFSDGLALVKVNNKYGFIDSNFNYVIPTKYNYAQSFNDGFAMVCEEKDEKYMCGYIDKKGNTIIKLKYNFGPSNYDNYSKISEVQDGYLLVTNDDKKAVFDTKGKQLTEFINNSKISLSGDGIVTVSENDSLYSLVDCKNKLNVIKQGNFIFAGLCKNGICELVKENDDKTNVLYGYIDYHGNMVIDFTSNLIYSFNKKGIAVAKKEGKLGLVDKTGKFIIDPIYEMGLVDDNSEEGFIFEDDNHKLYAYDESGKKLFVLNGFHKSGSFSDGFAKIKKDDLYYYVNKKGKVKYGPYEECEDFSNELAYIKEDEEYYFINIKGNRVAKITYLNDNK